MEEHDEVCLCFHVAKRTLHKFLRLEKPLRVSQLSECYGAGTGCGWCRPILKQIFESHQQGLQGEDCQIDWTAEEYAQQRKSYRDAKSG